MNVRPRGRSSQGLADPSSTAPATGCTSAFVIVINLSRPVRREEELPEVSHASLTHRAAQPWLRGMESGRVNVCDHKRWVAFAATRLSPWTMAWTRSAGTELANPVILTAIRGYSAGVETGTTIDSTS